MSTEQGEIYTLIPLVMQDIGSISKDRKNEQQKYSFRGIEDFYQAAHPAMIKHKIFCAPKVLSRDVYRFEKTNESGRVTTWVHVSVEVEHRFYAGDGSHVSVTTWGEGLDNSDKATNKAMSGAMKYALIELFCVPTKDVEDSDRESPEAGIMRPNGKYPPPRSTEPRTFGKPKDSGSVDDDIRASSGNTADREAGTVADPELVEALEESIAVTRISPGQATNLHRQFRKAIEQYHPEKALEADDKLYEWLKHRGYKDKAGNGSADHIPAAGWFQIRDEALEFAKTLKLQ